MIISNNSAIFSLELVQTIISQFVLIPWQKYEWFGNPHSFEKCFFLPKKMLNYQDFTGPETKK